MTGVAPLGAVSHRFNFKIIIIVIIIVTVAHEFMSPRHGASPRVADGRVGLQIWRLAASVLSKQSSGVVVGV